MRDEIRQIIGKTISGVIVKKSDRYPTSQVFLLFSDDTYYELYGDHIKGSGGVDRGGRGAVLRYLPEHKVEFEAHAAD